ncbi:hypothetical protein G7Z17_g13221 [Cylindrodendrum hubeiense]|uniref:Uncharacterized protein n=1 Tax=Cylindrodendrum hubeiense TaxID=595255 RepID=A0A9P5L4S7_9HYPO|nr:hypothetical protein G7Z17_g13221 [Cylindrodendrum hubeiense]
MAYPGSSRALPSPPLPWPKPSTRLTYRWPGSPRSPRVQAMYPQARGALDHKRASCHSHANSPPSPPKLSDPMPHAHRPLRAPAEKLTPHGVWTGSSARRSTSARFSFRDRSRDQDGARGTGGGRASARDTQNRPAGAGGSYEAKARCMAPSGESEGLYSYSQKYGRRRGFVSNQPAGQGPWRSRRGTPYARFQGADRLRYAPSSRHCPPLQCCSVHLHCLPVPDVFFWFFLRLPLTTTATTLHRRESIARASPASPASSLIL